MKFIPRKRTPKIKIDELDLKHFPKIDAPDPYWNDLYNPKEKAGAPRPNFKC